MKFQGLEKILKFLILFQISGILFGNERLYLKKANLLESSLLEGKNVKLISKRTMYNNYNFNDGLFPNSTG